MMLAIQYILLNTKTTNPNTKIYSRLEQSSTDNISFMDKNEESSENTYFFNNTYRQSNAYS